MNSKLNGIALLAVVAVLSGCNTKALDRLKPQTYEAPKMPAMPDIFDGKNGGIPGKIEISGAVVTDSGLDSSITVEQKAGKNKAGVVQAYDSKKFIKIQKEISKDSNFTTPESGSIISVGCDNERVAEFAGANHLKSAEPRKDVKSHLTSLRAQVVMLCGSVDFKSKYVSVEADTLIIDGLDYVHNDLAGVTQFNANDLKIFGANQISVISSDIDLPEIAGTSLYLEVVKSYEPAQGATLKLYSQGATFRK